MQNEKNEQKKQILNLLEQTQKFVNEFKYEQFEDRIEDIKEFIQIDEPNVFIYGKNCDFINQILKEKILDQNFESSLEIKNSSEKSLEISSNINELLILLKNEFLEKNRLEVEFKFEQIYKDNLKESLNLINELLILAKEKKIEFDFENLKIELFWPIIENFSFVLNFRNDTLDLDKFELVLFLANQSNLKVIKEQIEDKKLKNFVVVSDENKEEVAKQIGTKLVFTSREIIKNLQNILNSTEFDAQVIKALKELKDEFEAMKSELNDEQNSYSKNTKEFKKQMENLELNISNLKDTLLEKYNTKNLGFSLVFNLLGKSGSLFSFFLRRKLSFKRDIRTINKDIKFIENGISKIKDILKTWDEKNESKIEDLKASLKFCIKTFQFKVKDCVNQLFDDEAQSSKISFNHKEKIFKRSKAAQIQKIYEDKLELTKKEDIQKQIVDEIRKKCDFYFPILKIDEQCAQLRADFKKANIEVFDFDAIEFYEKSEAKEFVRKINSIFESFSMKTFAIYEELVKENFEIYINRFNSHIKMILNGELAFIKNIKDIELKLGEVKFSVDFIYRFSQINMKKQNYLLEKKRVANKAFSKTLNFLNEDWGKETIYDKKEKFVVYKESLQNDIDGQFIVITKEVFEDINEFASNLLRDSKEIIIFVKEEINSFLLSKESLVKEKKKASIDIKTRINKANEVKKELETLEQTVDKLILEQESLEQKLEELVLEGKFSSDEANKLIVDKKSDDLENKIAHESINKQILDDLENSVLQDDDLNKNDVDDSNDILNDKLFEQEDKVLKDENFEQLKSDIEFQNVQYKENKER